MLWIIMTVFTRNLKQYNSLSCNPFLIKKKSLVWDSQHWSGLISWDFLLFPTVSHLYGFGLMDAEAMVKEAEQWKQVPSQHVCVESADRQIR